jgi:hypothetical protein
VNKFSAKEQHCVACGYRHAVVFRNKDNHKVVCNRCHRVK